MYPIDGDNRTPPCDCCGLPAGTLFYTHPFTNINGPDGVNWGTAAHCLCQKCSGATVTMTCLNEFLAYKNDSELKEYDEGAVQELEVM